MGFKIKGLLQKFLAPNFQRNQVHFLAQRDIQIEPESDVIVGSSFTIQDMPDEHVLQISTPPQLLEMGVITPTHHYFKQDLHQQVYQHLYNFGKTKVIIPLGKRIMKCILKKIATDLPDLLMMTQIKQKQENINKKKRIYKL